MSIIGDLMTGHWERDGEEFHDLDEMWDYIRDNEYYFDEIDFERWVNELYSASRVLYELNSAFEERGASGVEGRLLEFYEEFEEDMWFPESQDEPIEGYNYHYGPADEFEFEWVEDDEDIDEEEIMNDLEEMTRYIKEDEE